MPAYNFMPEFAPLVLSGEKQTTIRRKRKRRTKRGDRLFLYTGMRTKRCRMLGKARCSGVWPFRMDESGASIRSGVLGRRFWSRLSGVGIRDLAWGDARMTPEGFTAFFLERYGLPFDGELIEWEDFEPAGKNGG